MKKSFIKFYAAISFFTVVFTGCQSVKVNMNYYSPIAVITCYSNNAVPWYTEEDLSSSYKVKQEDEGVITGLINRAIDRNNPEYTEVQSRVDSSISVFVNTLREFGIEVFDPEVVSDCSIYKKAGKTFFDSVSNTIPATGYDAITTSSKKVNKTVAQETGAKSLLYVNFKFQKIKAKDGAHEYGVRARVQMNTYVADENGKTLINKVYTGTSADYVPLGKLNDYDSAKLCEMFPEVVQACVNQFVMDYITGFDSDDDSSETENNVQDQKSSEDSEEIITFARKPKTYDFNNLNPLDKEKFDSVKLMLEDGASVEQIAKWQNLEVSVVEAYKEWLSEK